MLRAVTIDPVLNGWIVTVGCQRVVFNHKEHMLEQVSAYLDDPEGQEKLYRERSVNAKHTFRDTAVAEEERAYQAN